MSGWCTRLHDKKAISSFLQNAQALQRLIVRNERIIDRYLSNNHWRLKKKEVDLGRRVSLRDMAAKSNAPQYVDISFTKRHDIALIKATQGKSGRARSYICATCRIERLEVPISYKSRTLRCCEQCSVVAKATAEHPKEVYLHLECFGRCHR